MATNILTFSAALTATVLNATTRAARQAAIVTAMGTGTQTVSVKNGSGVEKLTGTFAGTAYGSTGPFLPTTTLSSVSGAGGTPDGTWTLRVTNGSGVWWQANFGAGNVWSYKKSGVDSAIGPETTTRIACALAEDAGAGGGGGGGGSGGSTTDWLNNNVTISTSALTPTGDEVEVLFAGRKTLSTRLFWVTPFYYPWRTDTQPPAEGLYGGAQWHGAWHWVGSSGQDGVVLDTTPYGTDAWIRIAPGSMLQFTLRNYSSTAPWSDSDYYFTDMDRWIDVYGQAGKKVSFHAYANISGNTINTHGVNIPSISLARYKDALQRILNRTTAAGIAYKDVIGFLEMPNEPDSAYSGSWNWGNQIGTEGVTYLAQLARHMSQIGKAVAPNVLVMGPSFASVDPHNCNAVKAVLEASAAGGDAGYGTGSGTTGADWIDVVGMHGYYSQSIYDLGNVAAAYADMRNKVSLGGGGSKPWGISEWMAFDGAWPGQTETWRINAWNDVWMWMSHLGIAVAREAQWFVHFTYKEQSALGDPGNSGAASRRAWRDAFVRWLTSGEITRIARTNNNTIRWTRSDGTRCETYNSTIGF